MKKYLLIFSISAFVFISSYSCPVVYAEGISGNADLNIELEVKAGCVLNLSNSNITFPGFYSLDRPLIEAGKLEIECTRGIPEGSAIISLDGGMVCGDDQPDNRWLYYDGQCDTTKRIKLNIYQGLSGSALWGEGSDAYTISINAGSMDEEVDFRAELPKQLLMNLPIGEYNNKFRLSIKYPA